MSNTTTFPNETSEEPFSATLRSATAQQHGTAEAQPFLGALMAGDLPLDAYADMVSQMIRVYAALESPDLSATLGASAVPFLDARLSRSAHLLKDVEAVAGEAWAISHAPTAAALRYAQAITDSFRADHLYVAHHYTRYMGDLSGGQYIGPMIARTFSLSADAITFYDFAELGDLDEFKNRYRSALDTAGWSGEQRTQLIGTVAEAYRLNDDIMAELWDRWGTAA